MTGITFAQMRHVISTEAERIGIVQRALVEAGLRKAPDPGQLQMKAIYEAIDRLIGVIVSDQAIMDRLGIIVSDQVVPARAGLNRHHGPAQAARAGDPRTRGAERT